MFRFHDVTRRPGVAAALVALVGATFALSGCPKDKAAPAKGTPAPKAAKAVKGKAPKLKGPGKVTSSFALELTPPKGAKAGEAFSTAVTLKPRGEYKVNMQYPFRLTVEGPAEADPKTSVLRKKDAKSFTEKGIEVHHKAKMPKAGEHRFSCEVKFSVCTKKHCELKTEKLTWVAKVQ